MTEPQLKMLSRKELAKCFALHDRMSSAALVEVFGFSAAKARREIAAKNSRIAASRVKLGLPAERPWRLHEEPINVAARLAGKPELEITQEQYAIYHAKGAQPILDELERQPNRIRGYIPLTLGS